MKNRKTLATLSTAAAVVTFAAIWLSMDAAPESAPLVAKGPEPCLQLADLRPRKAYSPADIASLCPDQRYDARFHGHPKPIRTER